jgi:hypothetical protein
MGLKIFKIGEREALELKCDSPTHTPGAVGWE